MPSFLDKRSRGRIKRWQRRWFEVDHAYLRYFSSEHAAQPKGAVSLDGIKSCALREGNQIVLQLEGSDSEWKLRASKPDEAEKWQEVFDSVIDSAGHLDV